jgi:predicted RNase H-like HicB family nuclease
MSKSPVTIEVELPLLIWRENDQYVAFTPALDLSTCGSTNEDAVNNFSQAVELFVETAIERKTIDDLLESLGWIAAPNNWSPPSQPLKGNPSFPVRLPIPSSISTQ